jgi:magnesium-protoporphyrin O-methyltransferase
MSCSCSSACQSADEHFNAKRVAEELARYSRHGPGKTTRRIRDGLIAAGVRQGTVLDIGGGLGILSLELLDAGFSRAVVVEASSAFVTAGAELAARRGRGTTTEFVHGDLVGVASRLTPSTTVTLDRVVCCDPLYQPLLEHALRLAEHSVALSYPRDYWYPRLKMWSENVWRRWRGDSFRTFIHPPAAMTRFIESAGFTLASRRSSLSWSCDVFVKRATHS